MYFFLIYAMHKEKFRKYVLIIYVQFYFDIFTFILVY